MEQDNDFFAPPPFKPEQALQQLQRSLREQRGLVARGSGFDWKGQAAVELAADAAGLQVRLVKRPQRSPEWESRTLNNAADVRRFLDDVKRRIARWRDADE